MKNLRSKQALIRIARILTDLPVIPLGLLMIIFGIFFACLNKTKIGKQKPRLLWASAPIKSLAYMARALQEAGYKSETVVLEASSIYSQHDFNYILVSKGYGRFLNWMFTNLKAYLFFAKALSHYDIFHFYFDGGVLRRTLLANFELKILKLLNKQVILMPYGSDAFVYDLITNPIWRHVLLAHYPDSGNIAKSIQKRIRSMTANADIVVGCLVHFVNLPRWDILPLTCYPIDTRSIQPIFPSTKGTIKIAHAPNHRLIKGTEYLQAAVKKLQQQGYEIELDIIEKIPNTEALQRISRADILVDQLIFGFALTALEGLALGKIVISAVENTDSYKLFRQYSYLNECPIIAANTENIYQVLLELIKQRSHWEQMGSASRAYVERRHSYRAAQEMFEAIYKKIWWHENIDLINFYHPLLEGMRQS